MNQPSKSYRKIYKVVSRIPKGKVATYGQVASLAGLPGHARQVGYALHKTPDDLDLPWQRVVNARGEVSDRSEPMFKSIQRQRLEQEGIVFNSYGRLDLKTHRWQPDER